MTSYVTKHTAVINGVLAVLVLFAVMKISNGKKILGDKTNKIWPNVVGWLTFVIMRISVIIMFASWANNEF
jgi:Mn2+/Fe2+ NRAMP family transporter